MSEEILAKKLVSVLTRSLSMIIVSKKITLEPNILKPKVELKLILFI